MGIGAQKGIQRIALMAIFVVVLFLVLSTATYAWYSANNVVQADNIVFTSSSRDTAGGLLSIGTTSDTTDVSITFDHPDVFHPMIPVSACEVGVTTYAEFVAGFNKTSEGGDPLNPVAKLEGTAIDPVTLTVDDQKYFYVVNHDDGGMKVTVSYLFDEEEGTGLKDKLHIAFFIGEQDTQATLLGIASLSDVHYGAIHVGDLVADTPVMQEGIRKNSGEMQFILAGNEYTAIRLVVWLDGADTKNEHGSKNMLFGLTFNGESIA